MMKFEKLNKIFTIQKGKKNNLVENLENDSTRVIQIDDLRNDNFIKYTNDNKGLLVDEDDILIAWDGANVGTIGYGKKGYLGSTLSQLKIINGNKYHSTYLGLFLKTKSDYFKNNSTGATIPHIHRKSLESLLIPIPENLTDQIRIAEVLTKVETLIQQRKESIDLLDDFLRSTFLDMFGDPVKNEKKWEMVKLSQLGSLDRGVSKNRPRNAPELLGGIYPLIQTGVVSNSGLFIKKYKNTYSELGLKQSKLWDEGTMLITIAANIAQTSILTFKACFPDSIVGFNSNKKESNVIYVHFLFSFFQKILEYNAPSSAQKNINLGILRELKVPKPSIKLQNKFALIVEKAEKVKEHFEQSLRELENLFGSLSQKAFKGELDLSKLDVSTQIREIEKKIEAESGLDISLESKLTKSMKQFIKQTADIQKSIDIANNMIPKALLKQIETINKIATPFQNLKPYQIPEQLALAMKSFDGIKSITSTLNEEKKPTRSSMRDLGDLENLQFDENEGLALIEMVLSKNRAGFTFADFETLLQKEKFKYNYKQIQQFIFKLIAEKKITQHFLSNKVENRLLQLEEENNEMFFGDERIWLIYKK